MFIARTIDLFPSFPISHDFMRPGYSGLNFVNPSDFAKLAASRPINFTSVILPLLWIGLPRHASSCSNFGPTVSVVFPVPLSPLRTRSDVHPA